MSFINTKYYWKELTSDGRLIDPSWAEPTGYEHEAEAIVHYYMLFTTDLKLSTTTIEPKYMLQKYYGTAI